MGRRQRCGAEEGARVEVVPGRGCRAAGVASAGRPRGERALTRSGHDAARERVGERGGRPGAALGWAGEARGAGAGGSLGRLRLAGQKRGGGPLKQRTFFFQFPFSINFQITVFKYYFEQENDIFLKWTKNES